jgi:ribonuclease HI
MEREIVFTDGSCRGNGTRYANGGIGVYFSENDSRNISEKLNGKQTNNRAELTAIKRCLEVTIGPLKICTDSMYVQKGITSWIKKWELNGWKTSKCRDVENKDLWQSLQELIKNRDIEFVYVKAHSGIKGNEEADLLANNGTLL